MAAATFCAMPAPAAASPVAAIAQVPIERMCGPDGVLGYRFGATDGPPNQSPFPGMTSMQLPPEFAPFDRGGLDSTKWSERIYAANYVAQRPDEESALAVIVELARRFEQLGWTADRGVSEEDAAARTTIAYIAPSPGDVHLYWPAGATGPERKHGVRIQLMRLGSEVNFSCTDLALFGEHLEEALGRLPEGTPRPVEPVLAIPPEIDPGTCDDPAKRAALLASRPEDSELIRYLNQRSRYRERLVAWKMDRLKKAAGLSESQAMEITVAGLSDPAAAGAWRRGSS